jgi:nitrite reductase (NADH) small subunit
VGCHAKEVGWTKLCRAEEVAEGKTHCIDLPGRRIALFHTPEGFFALDDHCPHRSGPLSEGDMTSQGVACPWHSWVFDLKTGECRNIPGKRVAAYPVREREGEIEIFLK